MQELIVSSTASGVARKKINESEDALLRELGKADITVDVVVPDDIKPDEFKVALSAVCKTFAKANIKATVMYFVLGRLMQVAEQHPDVYEKNFAKHEDFVIAIEGEYGVGRSTCFEARKAVARWGLIIETARFEKIGRAKLKLISKAVPKGDEKSATATKLLKMAEDKTEEELAEYCYEKGYLERGEAQGGHFNIPANKKQVKIFKAFFANPKIQAVCESSSAADILEHMIEEVKQEWIDKGEAALAEAKEEAKAEGEGA